MAVPQEDFDPNRCPVIENSAALKKHSGTNYQFVPKHLGELLVESGVITPIQLKDALIERSKSVGLRLGDVLEKQGLVNREQIDKALCCRFGVPYIKLNHFDVDPDAVKLIPAHIARQHLVMPIVLDQDKLIVAVSDPTDTDLINMLRFICGKVIEIGVATPDEIGFSISRYYGGEEVRHALEHIELPNYTEPYHVDANDAETLANRRPVVQLVQNLIMDAMARRASDIHVRPGEQKVEVFFRVDGVLSLEQTFDKNLLPALVSRIKIIGNLDISERRLPQDGRSRIRYMGKVVDLRISVMPSVHGESVVIRLLDTQAAMNSLEELGFSGDDATRLRHLLSRNNGIFLVTGPTGSGKSTTLYTALAQIRQRNVNIITVEDPVEYRIDGITQIQVNHQTGYSFARALRHILRHDPDVIMVGEVRDGETASMAVESALTGHLVLSTLHTNDAATTVARLLEIGIEPYLVNSSLLGVLAQRLVRCNCSYCLQEELVDPAIRVELGVDEAEVFYVGKGCEHCHETGVHGRRAVYELLTVSPQLKSLIARRANASEIQAQAINDGMSQLTDHALYLARQKLISLQEVYRVRLE